VTITVVTPWHNHLELAHDYWAAIAAADATALVIDNGSSPPLPNAVRLDENAGFSRACNLGLQLARTDAILWLNNDVAATSTDWLRPILDALEPGVLVGAQLRYDQHGSVDGEPLPYLDGWCLAGMRDDLLDLDGFDEAYEEPAYFSDNDLCLRARFAGMTLREARVGLRHKLNVTAGHTEAVRRATNANRERFERVARELFHQEEVAVGV
jgi:GT2 family glycosyltransferase